MVMMMRMMMSEWGEWSECMSTMLNLDLPSSKAKCRKLKLSKRGDLVADMPPLPDCFVTNVNEKVKIYPEQKGMERRRHVCSP